MKKSDFNVSMPLTAYDEFCFFQKAYHDLTQDLAECYEKNKNGNYESVNFNVSKARKICARFMPYSMQGLDIINVEIM